MSGQTVITLLVFGTLFAGLYVAVFGVRGARRAKAEHHSSTLAHDDSEERAAAAEGGKATGPAAPD